MENLSAHLSPHVAVIGAGIAGLSTAAYLCQLGIPVTVYEAAKQAGGRTRGVALKIGDTHSITVDNGQHLFLGAYHQTWDLLDRCGIQRQQYFDQYPLDWRCGSLHIQAKPALPSPLDVLAGLITARGISWHQRYQVIRLIVSLNPLSTDISVKDWLIQHGQDQGLIQHLWQPLCLAALNTPIQTASANRLIAVIQDGLMGGKGDSDMLLAKQDLSQSLVERLIHYINQQGGQVMSQHRLTRIQKHQQQFILHFKDQMVQTASHLVLAVPPARLADFSEWVPQLASWAKQLHYQPISTLYFQYPSACKLPAPMLGFSQGITQWVFDRGQFANQAGLMAAVISAQGEHQEYSQQRLLDMVQDELQHAFPNSLSTPIWRQCITEKRATYSCDVGIQVPAWRCEQSGILLAGDYLHERYPATIEAAVQSAFRCAKWIEAQGINH